MAAESVIGRREAPMAFSGSEASEQPRPAGGHAPRLLAQLPGQRPVRLERFELQLPALGRLHVKRQKARRFRIRRSEYRGYMGAKRPSRPQVRRIPIWRSFAHPVLVSPRSDEAIWGPPRPTFCDGAQYRPTLAARPPTAWTMRAAVEASSTLQRAIHRRLVYHIATCPADSVACGTPSSATSPRSCYGGVATVKGPSPRGDRLFPLGWGGSLGAFRQWRRSLRSGRAGGGPSRHATAAGGHGPRMRAFLPIESTSPTRSTAIDAASGKPGKPPPLPGPGCSRRRAPGLATASRLSRT
jgi:hypothetical protein